MEFWNEFFIVLLCGPFGPFFNLHTVAWQSIPQELGHSFTPFGRVSGGASRNDLFFIIFFRHCSRWSPSPVTQDSTTFRMSLSRAFLFFYQAFLFTFSVHVFATFFTKSFFLPFLSSLFVNSSNDLTSIIHFPLPCTLADDYSISPEWLSCTLMHFCLVRADPAFECLAHVFPFFSWRYFNEQLVLPKTGDRRGVQPLEAGVFQVFHSFLLTLSGW